jgi:hypothetical protein
MVFLWDDDTNLLQVLRSTSEVSTSRVLVFKTTWDCVQGTSLFANTSMNPIFMEFVASPRHVSGGARKKSGDGFRESVPNESL